MSELSAERTETGYRYSLSSLAQATWYLERIRVDPSSQKWRETHLIPERKDEAFVTSADAISHRLEDITLRLRQVCDEFDVRPRRVAGAVILCAATTLRMNEVLQITPADLDRILNRLPVNIHYKKRGTAPLRVFYVPHLLTETRAATMIRLGGFAGLVGRSTITKYMREHGLPGGFQHLRAYTITYLLASGELSREQVRKIVRHRTSASLAHYNARLDLARLMHDMFSN